MAEVPLPVSRETGGKPLRFSDQACIYVGLHSDHAVGLPICGGIPRISALSSVTVRMRAS